MSRLMSQNGPSQRTAKKSRQVTNQLRIIGGKWRGRKLAFPDVEGLRPTGDRVRETLFNWLTAYLPGARCLDLFAGSGALGLEALSRGAGHTTLIERNAAAARSLRGHCQTLAAEAAVIKNDALHWLEQSSNQTPDSHFELVFLDPPFGKGLLEPSCTLLENNGWLAEQAMIYAECAADETPQVPGNWQLHREKFSVQVAYRLYQRD